MQDFLIGQSIVVSHIADPSYHYPPFDMTGKRKGAGRRIVAARRIKPVIAVIIGKAVRQLGYYCAGRPAYSGMGSWGEDFDPPSLDVTGTVTLWQLRTGWRNRPLLAFDKHVRAAILSDFPLGTWVRSTHLCNSILPELAPRPVWVVRS